MSRVDRSVIFLNDGSGRLETGDRLPVCVCMYVSVCDWGPVTDDINL